MRGLEIVRLLFRATSGVRSWRSATSRNLLLQKQYFPKGGQLYSRDGFRTARQVRPFICPRGNISTRIDEISPEPLTSEADDFSVALIATRQVRPTNLH
jgi:hypothetical protein